LNDPISGVFAAGTQVNDPNNKGIAGGIKSEYGILLCGIRWE
jgi:hypothetical protein